MCDLHVLMGISEEQETLGSWYKHVNEKMNAFIAFINSICLRRNVHFGRSPPLFQKEIKCLRYLGFDGNSAFDISFSPK